MLTLNRKFATISESFPTHGQPAHRIVQTTFALVCDLAHMLFAFRLESLLFTNRWLVLQFLCVLTVRRMHLLSNGRLDDFSALTIPCDDNVDYDE